MLEKKLIDWRPVSTKKGRLKVLVLTDEGKKAISEVKIEKVFHKAGSREREYWKYLVGEYYRKKGYKVTFEYKIGDGKSVDLVAEIGEKCIAIEIETGKSHSLYNIRKDLQAGFDEVFCCVLSEKVKNDILCQLKEVGLDKSINIIILDSKDFGDSRYYSL